MDKTEQGLKFLMLHILIIVGVVYGVLLVTMYVFQRNFLYHPDNFTLSPAQSGVSDMDVVHFTTADGIRLFAWAREPSQPGKPWVVLFHGNAGTLGSRGYKARVFMDHGYGVLLVEYRGFGGNPGKPTEAGLMADARAALAYLETRLPQDLNQISNQTSSQDASNSVGSQGLDVVLYGESLGTGVAVLLAAERAEQKMPVKAVILEAPFTSTVDVGASHYPIVPVRLLMKDRFDSLSRIRTIKAPLFIVHGDQDWTVPQKFGRMLFATACPPKVARWIEGGEHNNLFVPDVYESMIEFLDKYANTR